MSALNPLTPLWIKSSLCDSANCVEVAEIGDEIMIRDSKSPAIVLQVSKQDWNAFAAGIARGDFTFS